MKSISKGIIEIIGKIHLNMKKMPYLTRLYHLLQLHRRLRTLKLPDTAILFVFPNIEGSNTGYKIAARLGGYEAVGSILQGLNAPINDLSHGCNTEEVYKLAIITAAQKYI